jgi:hypothetical protein
VQSLLSFLLAPEALKIQTPTKPGVGIEQDHFNTSQSSIDVAGATISPTMRSEFFSSGVGPLLRVGWGSKTNKIASIFADGGKMGGFLMFPFSSVSKKMRSACMCSLPLSVLLLRQKSQDESFAQESFR